jgi:hypothetical protein
MSPPELKEKEQKEAHVFFLSFFFCFYPFFNFLAAQDQLINIMLTLFKK